MQKKIIPVLLTVALLLSALLSVHSIHGLQGNARIINYAGVVRGATQRLIKQELNGDPNDALIGKLDGILEELATGEGNNHLERLNDDSFQGLIVQMCERWDEIKLAIMQVREGLPGEELYRISEEYFDLADRTVSAAEAYTERQVWKTEQGLFVLSAVILVLVALMGWYEKMQNRRQKALVEAETANRLQGEHLAQMSEDLQAPMNEITELLYVADPITHQLLFVNEAGRKTFNIRDLSSQKCYQALQGLDEPCGFCTNALLVPGENYTWEYTNPITGRHYLLKDRLIQWEGRSARMELAFDITEAEAEKQALRNTLDAEQMVMECVRALYQEHDLNISIPAILAHIGDFLAADRTYIGIVHDDGLLYNDYEWCQEGISAQKENLQGLPLSAIGSWLPVFAQMKCVILEDVTILKDRNPDEYELLHSQGICSLVAAPLERDGQLQGLLGVDNPPPERIRSIASLLQTLCYFLLLAFRRSESERQLSQLSYFDTLTSFYNRNRFMEDTAALDTAALDGSKGSVGVVYLDVNGLKDINDQYGHAHGDAMLVACTKQMREAFQDADFYRIGGDEFVILCPGISKASFDEHVSELHARFGDSSLCHVAIGAQWADQFESVQQLTASADAKMYADKKAYYHRNPTSNRYRHHSDEVLRLSDPEVLREEIRQKHFIVYLQPKISSSDRTTVGAEALIRYQSHSGSLLLPGNFLPLLEESETVSQIDFYVFEHACSRLSEWAKQGKQALPVSVNFSRRSLAQPDFVARLTELCRRYGVEKKYLEIELTETTRETEDVDLRALIQSLRQEGFSVSIDDFGTENANLALLSTVEFDVLKLDKSLVDDLATNPKSRTIVETIVDVCKGMQIQVVAEGVETEEQLSALRACGVELVQGFLFSKPIPIEEYEENYL